MLGGCWGFPKRDCRCCRSRHRCRCWAFGWLTLIPILIRGSASEELFWALLWVLEEPCENRRALIWCICMACRIVGIWYRLALRSHISYVFENISEQLPSRNVKISTLITRQGRGLTEIDMQYKLLRLECGISTSVGRKPVPHR